MNRNISDTDKAFRLVVGLALLSLLFIGPKSMWGLLGLIPLLTGLINFCPFYALMGISTCKTLTKHHH